MPLLGSKMHSYNKTKSSVALEFITIHFVGLIVNLASASFKRIECMTF